MLSRTRKHYIGFIFLLAFAFSAVLSEADVTISCDTTGVQDCTSAFQTAFTNVAGRTDNIVCPIGTYKISSTLLYIGDASNSLTFGGTARPGRGPTGCVLFWAGAAGGTIMEWRGANNSYLHDISFDGRGIANIDVFLSTNQPAGGSGSSGVTIERAVFGGATGAESMLLRIGNSNYQVDTVTVRDSNFVGNGAPGTTYYGITTGWANTKVFRFDNVIFTGLRYGIVPGYVSPTSMGGAFGYVVCSGCVFGNNTIADIRSGTTLFLLNGGNSEGSAAFAIGTTGGNAGVLVVNNLFWAGVTGLDDYVINNQGTTILTGSYFLNGRTTTSEAKVKLAQSPPIVANGIIMSRGNHFMQAQTPYAPLYGWNDVALGPAPAGFRVSSEGDSSQDSNGGNYRALTPFKGY